MKHLSARRTAKPDIMEEAVDKQVPRLGTTLKRLRQSRGMSLQVLAGASGVSLGMLSQVERDIANPSLRVLTRICQALGTPISALFPELANEASDPAFVRRATRRPRLELGYLSKELLSSGTPHNLQVMILHIPPNGSSGEQPLNYPAEKAGLVLEGEFILKIADEQALLHEGDSFAFDSSRPHSFRNPTGAATKVLWIIGAVAVDRHL
jgi:transcriptional regulator with XRE-family HTH domain